MAEQFANKAQTTLNGGIDNSVTSLVVTSATGFPTVGNFRIFIKAEGGNTDEICTVTGVAGTTYTIIRASEAIGGVQAASAHNSGAEVVHVLTAGALKPPWDEYISGLTELVHWWKMNEASGDFYDLGSGEVTLISDGSITYQEIDPFGVASAARFNTGAAYAESIGLVPTGSDPRTIIMLFKCAIGNATKAVCYYGNANNGRAFMYQIKRNDAASTSADIFDLWGTILALPFSGGDGLWHMIALGIVNTRIQLAYFDGDLCSKPAGNTVNTGTDSFLILNNDGADITIAEVLVFNDWIGKAKLDKLWSILSASLN